METVLIIGNKPYYNIDPSSIFDSFDRNCRCNMSTLNNNGTKYNDLALCSHLYDKLISNKEKYSRERFIKCYQHAYKEDHMERFLDEFEHARGKYSKIYYANPRTNLYNHWLQKHNSPYKFSKQPRTGYVALFEELMKGNKVYVANFSIHNEIRVTPYVKEEHYETVSHSAADELNILRWLHQEGTIDATLCLLGDFRDKPPTLVCGLLEPTDEILNKLTTDFGSCIVERSYEKKD